MTQMIEHFGITQEAYARNLSSVPLREQINAVCHFQIGKSTEPFSKINLLHYIDRHGSDFMDGDEAHHKIAKSMYECLEKSEKAFVIRYISDIELED